MIRPGMGGSVRLGVIGCGVIGSMHLRAAALAPEVELAGTADRIPRRAQAAAERFGAQRAYGQTEELIADPGIDAVVLALPAAGRAQVALQALAAGKHVLVEKPPAMRAGEVEEMLAAQGDRIAGCCSCRRRFYDSYAAAEACVAAGDLGEIREVYCRVLEGAKPPPEAPPPSWRVSRALNGGGIAANWSSYDLDYLLGMTGWRLRPELTLARTWPVAGHLASRVAAGSDAESHYAALILCAGGVALHLERSEFAAVRSEHAWQVIGSRGSLRLRMEPRGHKQIVLDQATDRDGVVSRVIWEGTEEPALQHRRPVSDFCRAILDGRPPKTTLRQALVVQRILDSIYASAERGAAVEVEAGDHAAS